MSSKNIFTCILLTVIQVAMAQDSNGLFSEWTETDYSNFEITHEYFTPNGTAPSASGGYDMTGYIPVKEGDVIVFSGDRSPGIPFMVGYADNKGNGAVLLLGDFDVSNHNDRCATGKEVTIPAGMAYVRCSARNASLPEWASRNMSVIKRSQEIKPGRLIRILTIGNSFSADVVESFLYDIAKSSGITLVIGNAVQGGASLSKHWNDVVENISNTEYRKIDSIGHYTLTTNHSLHEILDDEPWDVITFQQVSQESGQYDTYYPYIDNLIDYVHKNTRKADVHLGFIQTWAYSQKCNWPQFSNYNNDQQQMYDAIMDAVSRVATEHPQLEFVVPCGTAIQNLRNSFIGDNLNRGYVHLNLEYGRYATAFTFFATVFGEKTAKSITYSPDCLGSFISSVVRKAALDAVRNPYSVTPQVYPGYEGDNTTVPADILLNFSFRGCNVPQWNDIGLHYTYTPGLFDVNGHDTNIIIRCDEKFSNANSNGPSITETPLNMPPDVSKTSLWGYSSGDLSGTAYSAASTLVFEHLNKALCYDFTFYSSRDYASDNRETLYTVMGKDTLSATLDASYNRTETATISNIRPGSDGIIRLTVSAGPDNNNVNRLYYLNAMRISCHASMTQQVIDSNLGLPIVCITTIDGAEPTSRGVMHPDGLNGASITDVVAKEAKMQIYRADTLWYDSGEYQKDESGIKIKHRGNTSAYYFENKPFKIKLQKKADLVDFHKTGDTIDRGSKDWLLLNDAERLHVYIANQMARFVDMEYVPRMEFVNVIINNDYRGIYMLSENVKRDKDCRVNVDKEDGYIIELDSYFWNEEFSIPSKLTRFLQWTMKYPEAEDLSDEMEANIRTDIERLETAVSGGNYTEVIDVTSVARWILLHDIMGTHDPGGSNIYVARQNMTSSSLIRMPVAWDMGSSMENPDDFSRTHTERGLFFSRLFANEQCQDFVYAYVGEWKRVLQSGAMERMRQFLQSFPSSEQGQGLVRSYPLHTKRWNFGSANVAEMVQNALDWFATRESWLDCQVTDFEDNLQEISGKTSNLEVVKYIHNGHLYIIKDGETYTIDGKRVKSEE